MKKMFFYFEKCKDLLCMARCSGALTVCFYFKFPIIYFNCNASNNVFLFFSPTHPASYGEKVYLI